MEILPERLWRLFLESFFLGIALGIVYSTFSALRILLCEQYQTSLRMRLPTYSLPWIKNPFKAAKASKVSMLTRHSIPILLDITFSITATLGIILLAFVGNHGRIRWFFFLGAFAGFGITRSFVFKWLIHLLDLLFTLYKILFCYIFFIFSLPFRLLFRMLTTVSAVLFRWFSTRLRNWKEQRYRSKKSAEMQKLALTGFGCPEIAFRSPEHSGSAPK